MDNDKQYQTNIDIRIEWIAPKEGKYRPHVRVWGDRPDYLDPIKLIDFMISAVHVALNNPQLAEDGTTPDGS